MSEHRPDDTDRFTTAEHDALQAAMLGSVSEQRRHRARHRTLLTLAIVGGVGALTTIATLLFAHLHGGRPW